MKKFYFLFICLLSLISGVKAQTPTPALVGYWHNWNDANAPYIQLTQVDSRYNVIVVAFAIPSGGTDYKMDFVPDGVTKAVFTSQVQTLKSQGKKVLISVGGATAPIALDNTTERDTFVATMNAIITTYGFDGMDIDLEGASVTVTGGSISAPTDAKIINLIDATKKIMSNFYTLNKKKMILSMAPETAFVQGGKAAYGSIWGAYLPVIHALRDSLDMLMVQLYNSGSMPGLDGINYAQGSADFIVAMTEMEIQGFTTTGGAFTGLPANKVVVGLPACPNAAGGGYTSPAAVKSAIQYLMGKGSKPGSYTRVSTTGYPNLKGMMTWSVNWDAVSTCGTANEFAINYSTIFGNGSGVNASNESDASFSIFPNPANRIISIQSPEQGNINSQIDISDAAGKVLASYAAGTKEINVSALPRGMYFVRSGLTVKKLILQ